MSVESNAENAMIASNNWKTKALLIGAALGALVGLGTAYLLISRVGEEQQLQVTPGQGVKMGLAAFTFLRQITQLGE